VSFFQDLLHQVGAALNVSTPLELDAHQTCALQLDPDLQLFLELDKLQENIIIGCPLGQVPPGGFGNRLLMEALKANGYGQQGVLAYSTHNQQLVLFEKVPLAHSKPDQVVTIVQKIIPRAKQWHEAIQSGNLPPPPEGIQTGDKGGAGMFGIKR
jgi:hypothetical protein